MPPARFCAILWSTFAPSSQMGYNIRRGVSLPFSLLMPARAGGDRTGIIS